MMLKISLMIVAAYCCIAAMQGAVIDAEDRICPYDTADMRTGLGMKLRAIKNQGVCTGCGYAYAAIAALEMSNNYDVKRPYFTLSEQQIIDCSGLGVSSTNVVGAWSYIQKAGGVLSDIDDIGLNADYIRKTFYRYNATSSVTNKVGTCAVKGSALSQALASVGSWSSLPAKDIDTMMSTIQRERNQAFPAHTALTAPMHAVADFLSYKSGVYSSTACSQSPSAANHVVTIIGYNRIATPPYWIIRNSMGTTWGMSGYGYVLQGSNTCGIENSPAFVTAAKTINNSVYSGK